MSKVGVAAWFTNIASCLGHVLSRLGHHESAIGFLQQSIERTKASGILVSHANELAWLAEAFSRAGDHPRAARQAEDAIVVAQAHEERGNEALARVVLAEALHENRSKTGQRNPVPLSPCYRCRMPNGSAPFSLSGRTFLSWRMWYVLQL